MATVSVRYIVHDVDAAIAFYSGISASTRTCTRPRPSRSCPAAISVSF